MATATHKLNAEKKARPLAEELVKLFGKNAKDLARIDELKTVLKTMATDAGESLQLVVTGKGKVKVAGKKDKQLLGEKPQVVDDKFVALSAADRKALLKSGVVAMVENWSGAYYGSVTVDLF